MQHMSAKTHVSVTNLGSLSPQKKESPVWLPNTGGKPLSSPAPAYASAPPERGGDFRHGAAHGVGQALGVVRWGPAGAALPKLF